MIQSQVSPDETVLIMWVGPEPSDKGPYKRSAGRKAEHRVNTEAEAAPEAGRDRKGPCPEPPEAAPSCLPTPSYDRTFVLQTTTECSSTV